MKKLTLLILILAAFANGFAQESSFQVVTVKKIQTDEIVTSLKVYNHIEVILSDDTTSVIRIVGEKTTVENTIVKINNGELAVSSEADLTGEKVVVYVPAKYLQSVYIHGASSVSTDGIISNEQLDVIINGSGTSAIKTSGKISQNTVGDFPLDHSTI